MDRQSLLDARFEAPGAYSRQCGFTMLEALVVTMLVVTLLTLAAPSMQQIHLANVVSSSVNSLLADVRYARSESIRRGGHVVLCRSDAPEDSEPLCTAAVSTAGWASGWIAFHDLNTNRLRDPGEPLLRSHARDSALGEISGPSDALSFTATGRLRTASVVSLEFGDKSRLRSDLRKVVCVHPSGKARVQGPGGSTCTPE